MEMKMKTYNCCILLLIIGLLTGSDGASANQETSYKIRSEGTSMSINEAKSIVTKIGKIPKAKDRFIANGNGTITDQLTNLMWSKKIYNEYNLSPSLREKVELCQWNKIKGDSLLLSFTLEVKKISLGGYSDWRIPTIEELASLIAPPSGMFDNISSSHMSSDTTKYQDNISYSNLEYEHYLTSLKDDCGSGVRLVRSLK